MSHAVALVTNRKYLRRCLHTVWQLRRFGDYDGDVVVIVGSDLKHQVPTLEKLSLRITPVFFPEIDRSEAVGRLEDAEGLSGTELTKSFQYQKFHVFDEYFREWDKLLYLDSGMQVFAPIDPLWEMDTTGKITAHSDAFPTFEWKLYDQFNWVDFPELKPDMEELISLDRDYFQTTMMLFDTAVITPDTVAELTTLSMRFPHSRTNDQGIVNLWALQRNLWQPLPTEPVSGRLLYEFAERDGYTFTDYVLLKYPRQRKMRGREFSSWLFGRYWHEVIRKLNRVKAPPA